MKLKQKLALMLAVMSAFSVIPSFSTLTTGGTVHAADYEYSWMSNIIKVSEDTELALGVAPVVTIKEDFGAWDKNHSIYLTVNGAEWSDAILSQVLDIRDRNGDVVTPEEGEILFEIERDGKNTIAITKKTDKRTPFTLRVPMLVNISDRAVDDISLKIEGESTGVRDATHIFATVSNSKLNVRFDEKEDVIKFANRGTTLNPIRIEENYVGSLKKGDKIELEINRGFEWDNNYTTGPAISIRSGEGNDFSVKYVKNDSDETLMVIQVDKINANRTRRISFELTDLKVMTEDRNSKDYGKVIVEVTGKDIEKQSITVAEYVDYGAETSVKKEGEFLSGRTVTLPVVTLTENVKDSIRFDRPLDIDFPEWVNVVGIKSAKLEGKDVTTEFEEAFEITKSRLDKKGKDKEIVSFGTVRFAPKTTNKALKLEVEFEVETKANAEGSLDITFGGRAIDKDTITQKVASVKPVIEVTTEKTKLDVGFKGQPVGRIRIKETEKDAIQKGEILVQFEDFTHGRWEKTPTVKVTEGNAKLGEIKLLNNGTLSIEVRSTSRELATIEISDGIMTTSRAIADGEYDIEVFGDAIIDKNLNGSEWEKGYASPYLTVGASADEVVVKEKVGFVIGKTDYTIGEESRQMDAAPFIDKNGRTMVPVRYVAEAIGVSPENILWEKNSGTVTIFRDNQVVQVKVNTPVIRISGVDIQMDTQSVIIDGRTYLPISWVARVLNIPYSWDDDTKTVTFQ